MLEHASQRDKYHPVSFMEGKAVCNKRFRTLVGPAATTLQAEIAPCIIQVVTSVIGPLKEIKF